jgi:pyruvate/2-oxoglutarate dehydrogenase complex dihydrolipoamide acyltransferase (E2) component
MTTSVSFDHRIVDGAYAAQFLVHLRDLLEEPALLSAF